MTKAVDIFAAFAVNETKALGGAWFPYQGDVEFLVAKTSNKNWRKQAQAQMAKNKRILDTKDADGVATEAADDRMTEIMIDVMAKTILLDWKGELHLNGEKLPYSHENAKKLLQFEGFRDMIAGFAADEEKFKAIQAEAEEKNLTK